MVIWKSASLNCCQSVIETKGILVFSWAALHDFGEDRLLIENGHPFVFVQTIKLPSRTTTKIDIDKYFLWLIRVPFSLGFMLVVLIRFSLERSESRISRAAWVGSTLFYSTPIHPIFDPTFATSATFFSGIGIVLLILYKLILARWVLNLRKVIIFSEPLILIKSLHRFNPLRSMIKEKEL